MLHPGPSILLGKALEGGTDTWLSADSTALSLRSFSSGNGRDEQRNLTLRLWQGGSLKLSKAGPTRGGRKYLDRLPGEGALLDLSLWRDSSDGARPLSRVAAVAVAGNPGMGPTM